MRLSFFGSVRTIVTVSVFITGAVAFSQPASPTYFSSFNDAVTGDNSFMDGGNRYWDIDPGADSYQNDFYERPTVQTYGLQGGRYSVEEYFEYLDIVQARMGFDNRFLYTSIDLYGLDKSTKDGVDTEVGLLERYGFRIGADINGRGSSLFVVDQPQAASPTNTVFSPLKTFGYRDTDSDVGGRGLFLGGSTGLSVTKEDNPNEEIGMNGYDDNFISDGKLGNGTTVLWSRINPLDNTIVEMAIDYLALGYTQNDITTFEYVEFEAIKGGPKDPANYLWNDKYNESEAGSPYYGSGGLSEFGTQGLGNIYELDTLRGAAPVPEPASMIALGAGVSLLIARRRRKLAR